MRDCEFDKSLRATNVGSARFIRLAIHFWARWNTTARGHHGKQQIIRRTTTTATSMTASQSVVACLGGDVDSALYHGVCHADGPARSANIFYRKYYYTAALLV